MDIVISDLTTWKENIINELANMREQKKLIEDNIADAEARIEGVTELLEFVTIEEDEELVLTGDVEAEHAEHEEVAEDSVEDTVATG
jgi:hypothetical protein